MTLSIPKKVFKNRHGFRVLMDIKKNPLNYFTKLMVEEGSHAWLNLNGKPIVLLNDAKGIEHVLQTNHDHYSKGHFNRMLKSLFGDSIFLHEGPRWKKRRQESAPVFANGRFEEMLGQMVKAVEAMFVRWDQQIARGELIDMTLDMTWFTLDAFLRALYHDSKDDVASDMQDALRVILKEAEDRLWATASLPRAIAYRLPKYSRAMGFLKRITTELINDRSANRAYPEDLLSRLIEHSGFSRKEIISLKDEILAFILAGHDTTAHAISWSLYNLSKYPTEQSLLELEVENVLQGRAPNMNDIKKLTYTRQILDEAMRLYPPIWTMSRQAIKDDDIPLEDGTTLHIPKGASVMMCHYAVHRREKYWVNPESFDPRRFSAEAIEARPKFSWFPFGGGPRLCLGFKFAQVESVMALAMIAQRYELALIPGQEIIPLPIIALRPNGPIYYRIKKRQGFEQQAVPEKLTTIQETTEIKAAASGKCPFHHAA